MNSALVQGEDSESDEEINTDNMPSGMEHRLSSSSRPQVPGVVAGEGSETDDEDDSRGTTSASEQTDAGGDTLRVPTGPAASDRSTPRSSRRSSIDSSSTLPPPS